MQLFKIIQGLGEYAPHTQNKEAENAILVNYFWCIIDLAMGFSTKHYNCQRGAFSEKIFLKAQNTPNTYTEIHQ